MTATEFERVPTPDIDPPKDESPETVNPDSTTGATGDFDPTYPGSTPDAPYGFKADGTPYVRRPRGTAGTSRTPTSIGRMPASESQATQAASLLATGNTFMGFGLVAFGMPMTASALAEANKEFEALAFQALLADPALCRKILSGGAVSGKVMLAMAYAQLAVALFPDAKQEIAARRQERLENDGA